MQQAVLQKAIASNPVRELERIESPKGHRKAPPRGLTADERRLLLDFVDADKAAKGADLPDLIRFAIGSGLRIGELCAVRWLDLNLEGLPLVSETEMRLVPVVAVRQNVYPIKGKGLAVHAGKTPTALRIVPLPQFATYMSAESRLSRVLATPTAEIDLELQTYAFCVRRVDVECAVREFEAHRSVSPRQARQVSMRRRPSR
jgi:integrase